MADPMVGEIRILAGKEVPPGWATCDGQQLTIREHKDLFAVLGTTYGGDGRTTFALPDLRGRTPLHATSGAFRVGSSGGEAGHALTESELPGHSHGELGLIAAPSAVTGVVSVASSSSRAVQAAHRAPGSFSLSSTGGRSAGEPHDNMQPYLGVTFVIALHGVSPSRK